jgi:hypothetical protein
VNPYIYIIAYTHTFPVTTSMAKGAAKDKKPAEKKSGDKGKGKTEEAADKGGKVPYSLSSESVLY